MVGWRSHRVSPWPSGLSLLFQPNCEERTKTGGVFQDKTDDREEAGADEGLTPSPGRRRPILPEFNAKSLCLADSGLFFAGVRIRHLVGGKAPSTSQHCASFVPASSDVLCH